MASCRRWPQYGTGALAVLCAALPLLPEEPRRPPGLRGEGTLKAFFQPEFSHRKHLAEARLTCASCHASVLESSSAADDNRPEATACLRCHPASYADLARRRPAPQRMYRFDHARHLALGNVGPALAAAVEQGRYLGEAGDLRKRLEGAEACGACHRGVAEVDMPGPAQMPRMADCLVCHTRVDPPFSCPFCHTAEAVLRPASHTLRFADSHSNRREFPDKSGCRVCHGVRFTCMGCH